MNFPWGKVISFFCPTKDSRAQNNRSKICSASTVRRNHPDAEKSRTVGPWTFIVRPHSMVPWGLCKWPYRILNVGLSKSPEAMRMRTPAVSIYLGCYSYQVFTWSITPGLLCSLRIKQLNYILIWMLFTVNATFKWNKDIKSILHIKY